MSEKPSSGKGALALMTVWALLLILTWLIVLDKLLEGGLFYGA